MLPGPPRSQDFQNMLQMMKNIFRKAGFGILQKTGDLATYLLFDLSELSLACIFKTLFGPVVCG